MITRHDLNQLQSLTRGDIGRGQSTDGSSTYRANFAVLIERYQLR